MPARALSSPPTRRTTATFVRILSTRSTRRRRAPGYRTAAERATHSSDAEHGARRTNTECECHGRGGGEAWALAQRSEREAHIAPRVEEPVGAARVTNAFLMSFDAAKVAPRTSLGVAFGDASVDVALRLHLE